MILDDTLLKVYAQNDPKLQKAQCKIKLNKIITYFRFFVRKNLLASL